MTAFPAPASQPPWRRAAIAFLACAVLALGMAVPHDVAADLADSASKVEIAESAIHPSSPAHFESARLKVHPPCLACLLQAQTGTVLCPPPAVPNPLALEAGISVQPPRLASSETPLTGPARAPPSLSSLSV